MVTAYYPNQYISTTLATVGGIDDSQTSDIQLTSVTNIETTKPGICCISYTNPIDTAVAEWVPYTSIDGSNKLVGATRGGEGYAAKSHNNGATIAFPISRSHLINLNDAVIIGGDETNLSQGVLDEDTMSSNSAVKLATQQSIKAYVDTSIAAIPTDGWISSSDTWSYASASTFTIAGVDRTAIFTKGTRLKFTQTSVKYAVVVSSSFSTNTTVTIAVNTDYPIANAAISANYYSYQANPQGYPGSFAYTPTLSGATVGNGTVAGRLRIIGNEIKIDNKFILGSSSAIGAENYWIPPVNEIDQVWESGTSMFEDTGTGRSVGTCEFIVAQRLYPVSATATGFRLITSTVPHTWATTDILTSSIAYKF